ncbi:MAG: hypothetical protein ABJB33_05055 [Gemmatimonadota bacterium]
MPSPAGWAEVPCAKCGARTRDIAFGEYCPSCAAERDGRALKLARFLSLGTTALVVLYVVFFVPNNGMARAYGWIAVIATLLIVRRVTFRVAREFLK